MPKIKACPKCGTIRSLTKNGRDAKKQQRYKCSSCERTFLLDNSTTSKLKISDYTFNKFIGYMVDDVTIEVIARNLSIDHKTALYYRYLVFEALRNYQDEVVLNGTIVMDETYVRIRDKRYKLYRPDGKGVRGISYNHLGVITMISISGICIAKVASRATPKPTKFIELCTNNIGNVKQFIHDGAPCQKQFMKQFKVPYFDGKREGDGEYSTRIIDSLHSNLKRYLSKHAGYRLKNLQHYLNFFVFRFNNTPRKKYYTNKELIDYRNIMIVKLYNLVIKAEKKITIRNFQSDLGITEILESIDKNHYF